MERLTSSLPITEYVLASFTVLGRKRYFDVGKTKRGKGSKWMVVVDGEGVPLGSTISSASPSEVKLIEPLLDVSYGKSKISRLIYDKAADSDPLRASLKKRRIELIFPHRRNRKKKALQDGRELRRYKRRWKVERTLACMWITLKKL